MKDIKLFINGEFCDSSENESFTSYDPATGEAVVTAQRPSQHDLDRAVQSAHNAFKNPEWKNMTKENRSELLLAISEKIKERKKELIDLEIRDSGSLVRKAKADIHNTASFFKVMSKVALNFPFEEVDEKASREGFSKNTRIYSPLGVCAQIIPWNFPLVMAAWKIGPVLATGCTTVLKSAEETPATAGVLAEIIKEVGVPDGVINIVTGGAKEGEHLITHPLVRKVAFTGSTHVGRKILSTCSEAIHNTTLELGGKSANIICADADLDIAVDGALYAFLYHSGQACDSGTKLLIDESIYLQFIEKFLARMKDIPIGPTMDPKNGMGPVINEKQFNTIMYYIDTAKREGGKLLTGGKRITGGEYDKGHYIEPTAIEVNHHNTIFHEEIFGPVVAITKFRSEDEAIEMANDSIYGLAGAVWSKDETRAVELAKRIEAGTVWINEYHLLNPGMPFGGLKQSGLGREMGKEGMLSYLEVKHLWQSECNNRSDKVWFDALF